MKQNLLYHSSAFMGGSVSSGINRGGVGCIAGIKNRTATSKRSAVKLPEVVEESEGGGSGSSGHKSDVDEDDGSMSIRSLEKV